MRTVAITAVKDRLICHRFDDEITALLTLPYIEFWGRFTFDKEKIRYHSPAAEKYWRNRKHTDKIHSTEIIYRDGKKYYVYYD